IPRSDRLKWFWTRKAYEGISRFQGFPIFGKRVFHLMSYLQRIEPFYPRRDLSKPTFPVRLVYRLIKNGLGKHLIGVLNENPLPLVCSFPIPALCAEAHGYKGDIYCLCTDTDIARSWAPLHPEKSHITYLAPTPRAKERLKLYGVRDENIVTTGFPLPKRAAGPTVTAKEADEAELNDLMRRMSKLDPSGTYHAKFEKILSLYLGESFARVKSDVPLSITFAIGGAGAQSDIALKILAAFAEKVRKGEMRLNLVAGTSSPIMKKFDKAVSKLFLKDERAKGSVTILYDEDKYEYFRKFNALLRETDILWTKPSELSFYAGLGLPIVMSPSLGSQEEFNRSWLYMMGAGFEQYDPRYADEWLFDWIQSGWLAKAAMNGFLNAPQRGTERIKDLVLRGVREETKGVHFV
ncbi:MAG: hypothetical protein P4L61_03155, partial [Candidatus Pacebacteria bacterium]|nr:hypothetical protein [Candidatus Paceibacterota bacterium]